MRLAGVQPEVGRRAAPFLGGRREHLAFFACQLAGERIEPREDQVRRALEYPLALLRVGRGPGAPRPVDALDRGKCVGGLGGREGADQV